MPKSKEEIELHSDAWERFERAVGTVTKSPPQHRPSKKKKASAKDDLTSAKKKLRRGMS